MKNVILFFSSKTHLEYKPLIEDGILQNDIENSVGFLNSFLIDDVVYE